MWFNRMPAGAGYRTPPFYEPNSWMPQNTEEDKWEKITPKEEVLMHREMHVQNKITVYFGEN